MGSMSEDKTETQLYDIDLSNLDDFYQICEHTDTWFLGSLMQVTKHQGNFSRLSSLHNRITHNETNFDERLQANKCVASQLAEFFPFKWLSEITLIFRKVNSTKLAIKTFKDRVCSYLGFIELYLTFRGLTLLDSTLMEINSFLSVDITKNEVRSWKLKLLHIIPELREQWIKSRAQNHQSALLSTVVEVMNKELVIDAFCSKEEIFLIKQACLQISRKFISTQKAQHIKKPETWARAICVKAFRKILPDNPLFPIRNICTKSQKVIENKRWQLDKVLDKR